MPTRLAPSSLLLICFASGCAALIYEVVWFQLLQLVIGSSAISLAVLLGTFMGGMGLGSLLLPRLLIRPWHPLRVYAALELGLAACGFGVLWAMPSVNALYVSLVGHGHAGLLLRALVCAVCLLPPTLLMGATLPAIARGLDPSPQGIAQLGFFYAGNTVGAVAGCLLAGFHLLRLHDQATASLAATALNLLAAGGALLLAPRSPQLRTSFTPPHTTASLLAAPRVAGSAAVLATLLLSGLCALAAEVVWTRVLSLLLGATVYTFALILAVFLTGLALGSSGGAFLARHSGSPRRLLALLQALQLATLAWATHAIHRLLPWLPVDPAVLESTAAHFGFDLLRCTIAILPSALLWGASFPLALAALAQPGHDPARLVGQAYAANTLGAILGAVLASLALIPLLGSQHTQALLLLLTALATVLALRPRQARDVVLAASACLAAAGLAFSLPPLPWQLVAYGRQTASTDYGARPLFLGEGINASVAVTEIPGDSRFFHISGKTEASSLEKDMRLQRMLGHLPALLHPEPRSILIVGCGAGVTAGSFVLHPSIRRIVICDIEPLIPRVVASHFARENHDVLHDPRVEIVHDDARHYVATTRESFDVITSDPIHPWVKGSAVLYSREYFELCRRRLNPGGLVTQWVPLYESDRTVVRSELATFLSVFPHGTIWSNDDEGLGYDTVLLGHAEPLRIDVTALRQRLAEPAFHPVLTDLDELGLGSALELLSTYAGRLPDLQSWLAGAEINRDHNLRLQYLAGLQLNASSGPAAHDELLRLRRFPESLFDGDETDLRPLRQALAGRNSDE
jgi:spermidine synthase